VSNFNKYWTARGNSKKAEVFTPSFLVREILNKIPSWIWESSETLFLDLCFGSGTFIQCIIEKLREYGHSDENISRRIWGIDISRKWYNRVKHFKVGEYNIENIYCDDSLKTNILKGMKFDVVCSNPPYKNGLHLRFLNLSYLISKQYILWLSPSSWILDEKKTNKSFKKTRDLINKDLKSVILFNGNNIFNVGLFFPFSIIEIDKKGRADKIKVENRIYNNMEYYDSIDDINKWNDLKIYPDLKNKILSISKGKNLQNYLNKKRGNHIINLTVLRGNVDRSENSNMMFKNDFYSFFPKDIKIGSSINDRADQICIDKEFFFSFQTLLEANNFLEFLKTRWAMFALSLYKNNQQLKRGELASVPWLDWSRSWTEKDFEELIGATPEEKEFVYKNIPDYYGISK